MLGEQTNIKLRLYISIEVNYYPRKYIYMSKFVALDLETTGTNPQKDQILQIAAVVFDSQDLDTPIEKLPSFNVLVRHEEYHGSAYALQMNAGILKKLANGEGAVPYDARRSLCGFLDETKVEQATLIGFNVMSFDLPFLKNFNPSRPARRYYTASNDFEDAWNAPSRFETNRVMGQFFKHRGVDSGSLFANADVPQDSKTLMAELLHKEVSHDALEDCWDTIRLWRIWSAQKKLFADKGLA